MRLSRLTNRQQDCDAVCAEGILLLRTGETAEEQRLPMPSRRHSHSKHATGDLTVMARSPSAHTCGCKSETANVRYSFP
jgi:hypothetical protein